MVAAREADQPQLARRPASHCTPAQDTHLDSNYPRETFPIFLGAGTSSRHGPEFDVKVHRQKLRFFATSPYALPKTADDLRFWTAEQQILYTKLYCQKGVLFRHKYLDMRSLSS